MEKLDLNSNPRLQPAPERDAFDYGLAAAKAGTLTFPFLGAGVTLFDLITTPIRGRRLSNWLEELRLKVNDLSRTVAGLTPERLSKDEAFFSAFTMASQAALRTHRQEKLDALRNAVLNVVTGKELDADRQTQFIALVDRFTAAHLALLRFFQDPASHFARRHIPAPATSPHVELLAYQLVSAAMPEFCEQLQSPSADRTAAKFQILQVFLDDLTAAKLVALQRLKGNEAWIVPHFRHAVPYPLTPLTTHLGDDFLAFISEPRAEYECP